MGNVFSSSIARDNSARRAAFGTCSLSKLAGQNLAPVYLVDFKVTLKLTCLAAGPSAHVLGAASHTLCDSAVAAWQMGTAC